MCVCGLVAETVSKLTHLKPSLPHELLFLVLGRVRMLKMCDKPSSELVCRLLREVAAALALLRLTNQTCRPHLSSETAVFSILHRVRRGSEGRPLVRRGRRRC